MINFFYLIALAAISLLPNCVSAQNNDAKLAMSINEKQTSAKTQYCKLNANSVTMVNFGAPLVVFSAGVIKHDKKMQKDAADMMGAFALSSVVTHLAKNAFHKERPYERYSQITKRSSGGGYSFPSGHTSAAFTTATSISLCYPKWYVIAPAYIWAGSVGYSRVYQGVHYPSDVLAGAVVGAGSAWLTYKIQKWMDKKQSH